MGVPTLEVGYTSATTGRGDHEVHKGHVVKEKGNEKKNLLVLPDGATGLYHISVASLVML
jgi:hypothetical protein